MNRKMIMLSGILFCGSFGVMVASEAPVALFKEVPYPENVIVPIALTAEGKKIYDDLIAKYRNKKLTSADNTERNFDVLAYQREIILDDYHKSKKKPYYYTSFWGTPSESFAWDRANFVAGGTSLIGGTSIILSDYAGRGLHELLKGAANIDAFSKQKATLQSVSDFVGTNKSIVPKTLLAATAGGVALSYSPLIIGPIYNKIVDKYNEWLFWWSYKKEIALIDEVIKAIKAAR